MSDAAQFPPPDEPKPEGTRPRLLRSWRRLLTELAIVMVGVGLALAAQQAVEWLNWRTQVAQAREIVATEMTQNLRLATYRVRSVDCVERRLDELGAILDGAGKSGALPPVGDIGVPPRGFWSFGAWDSIVASQTATHFPRQQLADLTLLYRQIAKLEEFAAQEIVAWNSLHAMVGPGRRLDPASESRLRDALSQARTLNRLITGPSIIQRTQALGLPFNRENLAAISAAETVSLADPKLTGAIGAICTPIGPVPTSYGQGLYGPNRGKGAYPRFSDGKAQDRP